jgi:Zn-finger nucleic acid-binding protein
MRTYERSGVVIDQCTECRGVFLDRGELERLMDAEGPRDRSATISTGDRHPAVETQQRGDVRKPRSDDDDDEHWGRETGDNERDGRPDRANGTSSPQSRKRGGLLGNVFDMIGGGE